MSSLEENVNMLFDLSQPQNWKNTVTIPNLDFASELINRSPDEEQRLAIKNFWNDVGLGPYAQLDFDLSLSVSVPTNNLSGGGGNSGSVGGYLYNHPTPEPEMTSNAVAAQAQSRESGKLRYPPPNDLQLANILRLTLDCPFKEVRGQAAGILLEIQARGGLIPSPAFLGPTNFLSEDEWPSIEVESSPFEENSSRGDDDAIVESCYGLELDLQLDSKEDEAPDDDGRNYIIQLRRKKARLLSEAFLSSGRVDHTIQLMAFHPDYLEIFLKTHHFLMRGDGPLPYNHRNYIAIMAAARYQCSYLMELQKREFLYQGGDPKWLRGLESAPAKLLALYNINKIMAHRPWVLRKEDFLHLTKKAGWSLSEVVQAVVILAHFHALSSFIHGCGITPEIDFEKGHAYMDPGNFNSIRSVAEALQRSSHPMDEPEVTKPPEPAPSVTFAMDQPTSYFGARVLPNPSERGSNSNKQTKSILKKTEGVGSSTSTAANSNTNISPSSNANLLKDATHQNSLANSPPRKGLGSSVSEVEIIMATMKNLSETSPIEDPEERKKRFENVASADDSQEKENLMSHSGNKSVSNIPPEISPFVCDPDFIYEDFAKRGQVSEMHTFRIQDYSWEEHGFSLVNRLYTEVGVYLDEKFKVTQGMTYYTMGGRAHVDTTKFRTAVWNYIQCLYGIRHDDYDYGEVNQLLERPLKAYIKTVCCYPERITKADYDNVMREFKHSEKVHVNLMIMEAKIQAELLYSLRTIMRFLI